MCVCVCVCVCVCLCVCVCVRLSGAIPFQNAVVPLRLLMSKIDNNITNTGILMNNNNEYT